ncbi:hypothetical protein KY335_04640 [Candidatus Woesearchaeota archaeon]|nr:hypothetical protein [Candidatus Woesearchaeota archaeon]
MTTYSKLGPYKGKIVDAQPISSSAMELTIEGPQGKKYKYTVGKRSEFIRRAFNQKDNKVSFSLNERGKIILLTKTRYRK